MWAQKKLNEALIFWGGEGLRLCFFVSFIFSIFTSEVLLAVASPIAKEGKKDTSRRWTARHEATRKKSFTFFFKNQHIYS